MKKVLFLILTLILVSTASAHGGNTFAQAEELVKQKIPCSQLSNDELELIGDFFMEQMHPGQAHELMDEQMGGEGSETLKQTHINMAKSFYCGEHEAMSSMMNTMMERNGGGMMTFGMMGSGFGMMGLGMIWSLIYVALAAFIFGIIFWWTYKLVVNNKPKKKR